MILKDNEIVLRSAKQTRKDWDQPLEEMANQNDDYLLDQEEV